MVFNKKRRDLIMKKMSSEAYLDMLDKLADEVIEGTDSTEKLASDNEDVENMAKHAMTYYEQAQMMKEAAEADFVQASAYEDAAIDILSELGYLDEE